MRKLSGKRKYDLTASAIISAEKDGGHKTKNEARSTVFITPQAYVKVKVSVSLRC